jgi:hypothetical protein
MSRKSSKSQKRDWRWYASFSLNALVALSMVLGSVLLFTGAPQVVAPTPTAAPTIAPTLPPAPAPTVAPPTPTPKASAGDYNFAVAGDSRDGDFIFAKILEHVQNNSNEFLIHLSDMVSNNQNPKGI